MEMQGIDSILSWFLTYQSRWHSVCLDILYFDVDEKMGTFCALFGKMDRYGVHKKWPKSSYGQCLLNFNDVINIVLRCSEGK
jgi:hypothetical protein